MPNGPSQQQRPGNQGLSDNDEDLVLFQEVEKRESEAALPLHHRGAAEDIFSSSEWDKHDYDWLMTPPATSFLSSLEQSAPADIGSSLNGSVPVKKIPTPVAKVGSSKPEFSRAKPSAHAARRSFDVHKPADSGSALASTASRKSLSAATRSSTPTRPSTSVSKPIARPSTPIKSAPFSASKSSPAVTSVQSKMPTARAASNHSASSTRPLSPIKRSSTPTCVHRPSPASLKATSVNIKSKTRALPVKSVSLTHPDARAQVPLTHPVALKEESSPNVRSSAAGRPLSNPRGSLASRHSAGIAGATKAKQPQTADVGSGFRASSRLVMASKGRLPSDSLDMEKFSSRGGKLHDSATVSISHSADSKMVGKTVVPRKSRPLSQRETHVGGADIAARKAAQPTSPRDRKPTSGPLQSAGFGRNLSRKSLDMALRHMDIGGDAPNGVQSFMSNNPTSSLYSVRSRNSRASSCGRGKPTSLVTTRPVATSSNASAEQGLRIIIDLEGSELGDETSSSRTSPVSQPDPSMATSNERKVSCWLGNPDYMDDDGAEMMKNFEQELASVSGTDSPLGSIDCGDFPLEPI